MLRDALVALAAGLFWAAIIEILHIAGWRPDRRLAGLAFRSTSTAAQRISFWGLAAAGALVTLLLVNWFLPVGTSPSRSNQMGDIIGNKGIITEGQTGGNKISR